jgi:hypothetical protein
MKSESVLISIHNVDEMMDEKMNKIVENNIDDLNFIYELDFLGFLEIESKYLQPSIISWLIATLKLVEIQQHIDSIYFKINSNKNLLIACKPSDDDDEDRDLFSHKLTNIFKITQLANDPLCFGYIYRDFDLPNKCCLFAFRSNKVNLVQMLIQVQYKAIKFEQIREKNLIKKFEADFVGEVSVYLKFFLNSYLSTFYMFTLGLHNFK